MEMVEVKTQDLIGPALDWAVMQAVHGDGPDWMVNAGVFGYLSLSQDRVGMDGIDEQEVFHPYTPSTDWEHGGSLIEKHAITLAPYSMNSKGSPSYWVAEPWGDCPIPIHGDTALIAACRAIVAAKLGDTVSVPKELMQ